MDMVPAKDHGIAAKDDFEKSLWLMVHGWWLLK